MLYNVGLVTFTVVNDEKHPQLLYYWWRSWSLRCYFRAALIDMRTADGRQAHLHWRHLPPLKKLPIWSCPGLGQTRSVQCSEKEQLQDNFLLVSASTFLFFFFFFSPSCLRRRPPVPEQPLSHQQTSGIPRATIARSESLDCRDENRLFSWSGAKAIKKVIFFSLPPLVTVRSRRRCRCLRSRSLREDGTVRGEMRRGGQRNFRAAQAFCPQLSLHTWTGASNEDEYGNYVQTPLNTQAMSFQSVSEERGKRGSKRTFF